MKGEKMPQADELEAKFEEIEVRRQDIPLDWIETEVDRRISNERFDHERAIKTIMLSSGAKRDRCSSCGARVWFLKHANGRTGVYTDRGLSHFADCPKASSHRPKTGQLSLIGGRR